MPCRSIAFKKELAMFEFIAQVLEERRETKLSPSFPLIPFHVVLLVPTLWKSPSNECRLLHPFHRLLSQQNFGKRQTVVFVVVVVEQSLSWHSMHFVGILHLFDLTRIVAVKKAAGKLSNRDYQPFLSLLCLSHLVGTIGSARCLWWADCCTTCAIRARCCCWWWAR